MAVKLSVAVRNARLDAIETTIGTTAILRMYTGAPPVDCATAATGTVVATMTLPSDWLASATSGTKAKLGTWEDVSADAAGTVGYFRIYDAPGTTCHLQGAVTLTGGGGDMTLDNTVIGVAQDIFVTSFTLTDGNA